MTPFITFLPSPLWPSFRDLPKKCLGACQIADVAGNAGVSPPVGTPSLVQILRVYYLPPVGREWGVWCRGTAVGLHCSSTVRKFEGVAQRFLRHSPETVVTLPHHGHFRPEYHKKTEDNPLLERNLL